MTKQYSIHVRMALSGVCCSAILVALFVNATLALAQERLADPVYRLANDSSAAQAAATGTATAATPAPASKSPFDLTKQGDEHPLMPLIRVTKASIETIDQNVHDYSCTLVKRERVDGELGDFQHIFMKVKHEPFSVYMSFLQPYQGREVLYVDGKNENQLVVLEAGWKRTVLGKLHLDPTGTVAMSGQKYPITKVGMRNLLTEILKTSEADTQFAECEVTSNPEVKISGRTTTMIQIVHPLPRKNFRAHVSRIFFDNELRIPIHYDAFSWPEQAGQQPPLEESYTYTNLKINNSYTARDFDATNNPDIFKL